MVRSYKTVIVDAKPGSAETLQRMLQNDPEISLAGTWLSQSQAIAALSHSPADILIQRTALPDGDGFSVFEALPETPSVVMVSDTESEAARAFDFQAVDFVRSPFDAARFETAIKRAKRHADSRNEHFLADRLSSLLSNSTAPRRFPNRFTVKNGDRTSFVAVSDIEYIEADGNYVVLHAEGKKHLVRETMTRLLDRLDPEAFVRIHRSTIVNIDLIKELQPWFHGDYMVLLKNGKKLTMSRNFRKNMQLFLEQ
jgi:two-component system LytT family response regulator